MLVNPSNPHLHLCRLDGHHRQPSLTSELKLPPESDNESIADYADGMGDGKAFAFSLLFISRSALEDYLADRLFRSYVDWFRPQTPLVVVDLS